MNRINTSHQSIAAKQRNCNYHPNFAMPEHVRRETQEIDSTEAVVEMNGSFWVASKKFTGRYYRVTAENGEWMCSASDERVARMCKAAVEAYIEECATTSSIEIPSWTSAGVTYPLYFNRKGEACGCGCPSWSNKMTREGCKHMRSHNQVFSHVAVRAA